MSNIEICGYYVFNDDGSEFIHYRKDGKQYLTNGVRNWSSDIKNRLLPLTEVEEKDIDMQLMYRGLTDHLNNEEITSFLKQQLDNSKPETRFVTISVNDNQILGDVTYNDKIFSKLITPDGFTFLYNKEKIRKSDFDDHKSYFSVPTDYSFKLVKSVATEEVDREGKKVYEREEKNLLASDLRLLYTKVGIRQAMDDKFISIEISKNRVVQTFQVEQREYSRILAPDGYSFIRPSAQLHPNEKDGNLTFSLPRENYQVKMTKSVKTDSVDESGNPLYRQEEKIISPEELKKIFEDSKEVIKISFSENQIVSRFKVLNNEDKEVELARILIMSGYTFIKASDQITYNADTNLHEVKMNATQQIRLKKSTANEKGDFIDEMICVSAKELSNMITKDKQERQIRRNQRAR